VREVSGVCLKVKFVCLANREKTLSVDFSINFEDIKLIVISFYNYSSISNIFQMLQCKSINNNLNSSHKFQFYLIAFI